MYKDATPGAAGSIPADIHHDYDYALRAAANGYYVVVFLVKNGAPPGAAGILPADVRAYEEAIEEANKYKHTNCKIS